MFDAASPSDPVGPAGPSDMDHANADIARQIAEQAPREAEPAPVIIPTEAPVAPWEADEAGNVYRLRTPFLYTELRAGRTVTLPGVARHTLRRTGSGFLIVLKRVDLLHADEALPAVEFYI